MNMLQTIQPTNSSVELVEIINSLREEGAAELLRDNGVTMSAAMANKKLAQAGILVELTRSSSKGTPKKFWSVTEKGEMFGKNLTSPNNPKETQPQCLKTLADTYLGGVK